MIHLEFCPVPRTSASYRDYLSTHLTHCFWRLDTIIPSPQELWLVFDDLCVSEDIVHKTGQCYIGFCPHHSNTSHYRAVHRSFYETEDMLYTASGFRHFPVVLLLLVRKRMVTVSLRADDGIHATCLDHIFFGFIASIKIQVLTFVWLFKDICNDVRIVDFGCCSLVLLYKFGLLVCFDMAFITIVFLATFLCPTRIYVLVPLLVPFALLLSVCVTIFGIPKAVTVAFLDLLVLLLCVALAWCLNKRGIDYLALVERQSFVVKFCTELSNRRSKVPALLSLSLQSQMVFSSGISATVRIPRNWRKLVRSIIWYCIWWSPKP